MSFAIVDKAISLGNKGLTLVKPHLPTIMVVAGSASVVAGAFFACKATLKVDQVLEEHNAIMSHVRESIEKLPEGRLTKREIMSDKLQCYAATAGKLCRLYAPAIGLSLAGFAAIFSGFGMIKRWHALAVSSVAALDEKFGKYRAGVIKKYGKEVDKQLAGEIIETTKQEIKKIDEETGEEKAEEVDAITGITFENLVEDDFTRVFDCSNPRWENDYLFNDNFFKNLIHYYTKHLQSHRMDHVFFNTILKECGFRETGIGHFYGWTDKPGCALRIGITPCLRVWDHDESSQFPMLIPMDLDDEMDEKDFRQAYIDDEKSVCYILKFLVDTDENGVPHEIYNEVYGNHKSA